MSIKTVEFKDMEGDTVYINPAHVSAVTVWREHTGTDVLKTTAITCMGWMVTVNCSVEEARKRIWG